MPKRTRTRRRKNAGLNWTPQSKGLLVQSFIQNVASLREEIEEEVVMYTSEMGDYFTSDDKSFVNQGFALLSSFGIPVGAIAFLAMVVDPKTGYAAVVPSPFLKALVSKLSETELTGLLMEYASDPGDVDSGDYCDEADMQQLIRGELSGAMAANCYAGAFFQAGLFPAILMAKYENVLASNLNEQELRAIAAVSLAAVPLKKGNYLAIHYGKDKANPAQCNGGNEERCVTQLNFGIDVCMFDCTQALWAWVVLVAQDKMQRKKVNPKRRRNTGIREDWAEVAKMNPYPAESDSQLAGATRPIVMVSWLETISWLNCLSMIQGLQPCYEVYEDRIVFDTEKNGYRLPSEMEWEVFACANQCYVYAGSNDPNAVAWYADNSGDRLHGVGQKAPNGFGLYDCSGNVYEMTFTPYDSKGEKCGDTSWFNGRSGVNGFRKEQ